MSDQHNNAPAVPQGWKLVPVEIDPDMVGAFVDASAIEGPCWAEATDGEKQEVVRMWAPCWAALLAATPTPAPAVPQGWTDADSDAARLALELECLLLDTETLSVVSKWWASANEALELHRQRLATLAAPSQEPVTLTDDDIARCINVATCGRPFIGLMNPGGVPSAFSRSLADLLIAALREKESQP